MAMKQVALWVALSGAVFVAGLRGAEIPRVAVLDFTPAHAPGSLDPAIVDFSRAVQARLLASNDYAWVERQEFERITREADLGAASQMDAAAAVRLGHLLRADLLLRGEIEQRPGGGAELVMEVIDLRRAELLATRAVPVTMNSRQRLHPTAAEVVTGGAAALAALGEARDRLGQFTDVRVLAPLYFKNTSKSDRLDFLEARLQTALEKAAAPATGFRALRFPRTGEAGEESGLVLAGLTDTNPEAWQQVADVYLWGEFTEEGAEGTIFDEVPVTITLQIWAGGESAREVKGRATVKTLDADLEALARQMLAEVTAIPADGARIAGGRQKMAAALALRASQVGHQIGSNHTFIQSAAGRQLHNYRQRLLEIACFFDPLNRNLQSQRLQVVWASNNPFKPLDTVRGQWLRVVDYEAQARRWPRRPDGKLDDTWCVAQADSLKEFAGLVGDERWTVEKNRISREEAYRQRRAVLTRWGRVLAETGRAVAGEATPPPWYAARQAAWFDQAQDILRGVDATIAHGVLEDAWPVLQSEIGRMLKAEGPTAERNSDDWIERVFTIYGTMGDHERPTALFDAAWNAYTLPPAAVAADVGRKSQAAPPPPVRVDRPWEPWKPANPPPLPPIAANPAIPRLPATVREVEVRWFNHYERDQPGTGNLFKKRSQVMISGLAWHEGKLWIAETNHPLPAELGAPNPQGNHYLWSYDPATRDSELVTTKLGGHSYVRTLQPAGGDLWIGPWGDGVWRISSTDGAARRYKGEEGLHSPRVRAVAGDPEEVFVLSGPLTNLFINGYSLKTGNWTGLKVPLPTPRYPGMDRWTEQTELSIAPTLAVHGDWLCFNASWTAFYNRRTKEWVDLQLNAGNPPGSFAGGYSVASADEIGFWFGSSGGQGEGTVVLVDPNKPQKKSWIQVPGSPTAMAHHGPWLWVALGNEGELSRLALIDKRAKTFVGQVVLPGLEMKHLAVTDDRVWVGGSRRERQTGAWNDGLAVVEVILQEPRPVNIAATPLPAGDFPLQRAIWSGNTPGVDALLAGNPDVNAAPASGWTPLMAAAAAGRRDVAERLLAMGAKPNLLSRDGDSALQQAAFRGDLETARLLLAHGAQPDLRPAMRFQRLGRTYNVLERGSSDRQARRPVQPANLKAALTKTGEIELTWEDRSDNENHFVVRRDNGHGLRFIVGQVSADTTRWTDPGPYHEYGQKELKYWVEAVSIPDLVEENPTIPQVRIPRPTEPDNTLLLSEYGTSWYQPIPAVMMAQAPLASAAASGNAEMVSLLLAGKADPNLPDAAGYPPLSHAVRNGQYATARQLLAAGARPEIEARTGETAAALAYRRHEDEAMLTELLAALPERTRQREASALIVEAAEQGQIKDIIKLRAMGGDLGEEILLLQSALSQAVRRDQFETARWLLEAKAPGLRERLRAKPLRRDDQDFIIAIISKNRAELFAQLLDLGLEVNSEVDGHPVIITAAKRKAFAILTLLRDRGADLNAKTEVIDLGNPNGATLAGYLTPEEAKLYLGQAAAPVRTTTWFPPTNWSASPIGPEAVAQRDQAKLGVNTELLAACQKGDLPAAMRAVAAGAQLNCYGPEGRTPLIHALQAQAFDLVRWLVQEGASVNLASERGYMPVSFSIETGQPEIMAYLLQAGADSNAFGLDADPPLAVAAGKDQVWAMRLLLDAGANPNLIGYTSWRLPPLARALWRGNPEATNLLLARGANPRAQRYTYQPIGDDRRKNGMSKAAEPSLLMFAAAGKNLALVRQMVDLGQNPRLQLKDGYDALSWAAGEGAKDVVEYLLPLSEPKGRALESAEEKGHADIVRILERASYSR